MAELKVESEITGTVWKIEVSVGDQVEEDDVIVILESMKMEVPLLAPESGKIKEIHVAEEDMISEGQIVVTLEN